MTVYFNNLNSMEEINQLNFIISGSERMSLLKEQNGILPFNERPSDKHGIVPNEFLSDKICRRLKPFELFSLFTADIIKKNAVYTR